MLISADGQRGRIVETLRAGSPAVFHTHWQTMFAQGSYRGLPALEDVAARIEAQFGDRIAWIGCADLAAYTATAAAISLERVESDPATITLRSAAPFSCPRFTVSLGGMAGVRQVRLDGRPLRRADAPANLEEESFLVDGDRLVLCWRPVGRQEIAVQRDRG